MHKNKGFTLIELLVVIAIIGLLSTIVLISLSRARQKARDARRLRDVRQIRLALELYYDNNNAYPLNTDNDCGGWDTGYNGGLGSNDIFLRPLEINGFITKNPGDPSTTAACGGYVYYRYTAGMYGCDTSKGAYYVLGIRDMETSDNPHPLSPGWSCSGRDWQNELEWVTGGFEK
ncbi:MAG TPA: type II secretion system protein [Candidatus Paceibacterota bacterium]|nr:type II secretion system protein [Candidatus Paceibacterota bacterium]